MEDIIIVGYGGHAKSIADTIIRQNKYRIAGYTDVKPADSEYTYLGTDDSLEEHYANGICHAVIGIGYMGIGDIRERIYRHLKDIGYSCPVIVDPSAIVSESADIGEGTFVGKFAVVNAEAQIGKLSIINTKALVEHECVVGDYSHVAVGAVLCGQAKIGNKVLVGANATVLQTVQVGDGVRIGAAAVVTRDVPETRTVVGNPAKIKE